MIVDVLIRVIGMFMIMMMIVVMIDMFVDASGSGDDGGMTCL